MIEFKCTIGGQDVAILGFQMRSGAYGSVGHLHLTTGRQNLLTRKLDLFAMTSEAPAGVEVILTATVENKTQRLFGGEFLTSDWDFDRDLISIEARDYAGILVDQHRLPATVASTAEKLLEPLAPGQNPSAASASAQNQQLSQIVNAIALKFGLTPVLNLDQNPNIGTKFGNDDTIWMAIPQTLWGLLNTLARDTGYDVYVTPDRKLVFGLPGVGTTPVALSYGLTPVPTGTLPCRAPRFRHNARRNSTFRVQVMSYDPAKGQLTLGRANAVGTNLAATGGLEAGISVGPTAVKVDKQLSNLKGRPASYSQLYTYSGGHDAIPLYTFHSDGLTQDQADAKALAIATDIAKREITLSVVVDGFLGATPTQTLTIKGAIDSDFTKRNYYVYGYEHTFRLPRGHNSRDDGFLTTLLAVNTPIFGASPTS